MNFKNVTAAIVITAALAVQISCSSPAASKDTNKESSLEKSPVSTPTTTVVPAAEKTEDEAVIESYNKLVSQKASPAELIAFIDSKIEKASAEDASVMIQALEDSQKSNLPELEGSFNNNSEFQRSLNEVYKPGFDISSVEQLKSEDLKKLLKRAYETGYRIETAEGMYFPIINYSFLKKYSQYLTEDMKEYVEIMSIESDKVPAKDAALIISWDEILKRALRQEDFLTKYAASKRAEQVKMLYNKYVSFTLFGANNTPLFDYKNKTFADEAKTAYVKLATYSNNSSYAKLVSDYLKVLENNGYKLTDEVKKFRGANLPS